MFSKDELLEVSESIFPNGRYIYFLFDGEKVVYVGQSTALYFRFMAHGTNGKIFDRVSWIDIGDGDLNEAEADYIIKFNPKYNVSVPICKKYTRNTSVADVGIRKEIEKRLKPIHSFIIKASSSVNNCHLYHSKDFAKAKQEVNNKSVLI